MAKQTFLALTNRILRRITADTISDVSTASGTALIVTNLINEAQIEIYNQSNWYSLYTTRTFATVNGTATYAHASDFGRCINLMDTTNNHILTEDVMRSFDAVDPNADNTGMATHFAIQGAYYRLFPIPSGAYTIRERYWKVPTELSANANTSDLPIETENCIIYWAWYQTLTYLNKFEQADRIRIEYERALKAAILANNKVLDRYIRRKSNVSGDYPMEPATFPSDYPATIYR